MNSRAVEAKDAGAAAWKEGNYTEAVKHFTVALDNTQTTDVEARKLLYSNRSAAHLKLKELASALSDATKCCEINSNWSKGYVRKGDALFALNRLSEAHAAYTQALRLSPNDEPIRLKCDQVQNAMRNNLPRTGNWEAPESYSSILGDAIKLEGGSLISMANILSLSRIALVVCGLLSLLPFRFAFTLHRLEHHLYTHSYCLI